LEIGIGAAARTRRRGPPRCRATAARAPASCSPAGADGGQAGRLAWEPSVRRSPTKTNDRRQPEEKRRWCDATQCRLRSLLSLLDSKRVSKSNIETLEKCYLMWFLDCDTSVGAPPRRRRAGGSRGTSARSGGRRARVMLTTRTSHCASLWDVRVVALTTQHLVVDAQRLVERAVDRVACDARAPGARGGDRRVSAYNRRSRQRRVGTFRCALYGTLRAAHFERKAATQRLADIQCEKSSKRPHPWPARRSRSAPRPSSFSGCHTASPRGSCRA
jgi:hypothetical protein